MANKGPATVTVTSVTGPGQAVTALAITDCSKFEVDFGANTIRVTQPTKITYFDYSTMATLTWTISGGLTTITVSS